MASWQVEKDPVRCWNLLAACLSYGHTIPFHYRDKPQTSYPLNNHEHGYSDSSCAPYLLEDIQHALFDEGMPEVRLVLWGQSHGPITDTVTFTFNKQGLVQALSYYNDD